MATYAKEMAEERINTCLLEFSANPELRKRVLSYKKRVFPKAQVEGAASLEEESELDVSDEKAVLPLDWTRGSEQVEFDEETPASQSAVAGHV